MHGVEIKIEKFEKERYPNLLNKLDLSYNEMVKKLEAMTYVSAHKYDSKAHTNEEYEVEEKLSLPYFNKAFLNYIKKNNTFPTQDEYIAHYWESNKVKLSSFTSNEYKQAINNRVIRAYASLIRELMFAFFIKDKLKDKNIDVIYNEKLDSVAHIDIMICGKYNWGIHLYTNTRRGKYFRKKKNDREGIFFTNVKELDLELDLSRERKSYGNIFLYDEIDFQHLLELCRNLSITHN